jgi:hypothetical protein
MELKTAKLIAATYGVNVAARPFLLSKPDDNPKTAKNQKFGILTAPLHLAPARLSGFEVCPSRSPGCSVACLHTAGNPAYMAGKKRARIAKTKFYFGDRVAFNRLLIADLAQLSHKAEKLGLRAGVRFNATSDIPWERVTYDGATIIEYALAGNVTPYDYTKTLKRALANPYHLTFSRSENNWRDCVKVLDAGGNVAAVFAQLPKTYKGYTVADGDLSDWRPGDAQGVIIGLKAKGAARGDTSGFVIRD